MSDEADRPGGAESGLTPEQYLLIQDLVELASSRPADQREPWLRNALARNTGLLKEALELLGASDALEPEPDEDVPPGTQIGNYRVVRELGHGGMGSVYLASRADGAYDTDVAIKVVSLNKTSDDLVARFKRERRILASLDHQNIARLLDAGTMADGRPYFVMEFVRGRSITDYADFHNLSVKDRVRLFIAACGAVEYAHQKHVVHRDIKPSNIIVTDDGVPKLLDFGIATSVDQRARDLTRLTATGMAPGTPRYASPEQMAGTDVDMRADVYALGVVFFELLTGWWPFVQDASGETPAKPSDAIQTRPSSGFQPNAPKTPTPSVVAGARSSTPRDLVRQLRGDLDAIASAALREDPNDRYDSVTDFTADLRRFLATQPVAARPRTSAYRATQFARRHPRMTVMAATLVLVGGTSIAWASFQPGGVKALVARMAPADGQSPAPIAPASRPADGPIGGQEKTTTAASTTPTMIRITGTYAFAVLNERREQLSPMNTKHDVQGTIGMKVRFVAPTYLLDNEFTLSSRTYSAPGLVSIRLDGPENCYAINGQGKRDYLPATIQAAAGSRTFVIPCDDKTSVRVGPVSLLAGGQDPVLLTAK